VRALLEQKKEERMKIKERENFAVLYNSQLDKIAKLEAENLRLKKNDGKDVEKGAAEILESLINKLSEQLICPISMVPMSSPVILKSGSTVDESTFKKLK
jgi:hypothetical protein